MTTMKLDDLKDGDLVTHKTLGRGVVRFVNKHECRVQFDDKFRTLGVYDRDWFRIWPATISREIEGKDATSDTVDRT